MGFKYSPVVAQTVGHGVLRRAFGRCSLEMEDGRAGDPLVGKKLGRIVALGCVWYDNVLLVAGGSALREALGQALHKECDRLRLAVKEPGQLLTKDEVIYLGLHMTRVRGGRNDEVSWCHVPNNITKWKIMHTLTQPEMSGRKWLQRLGVLAWHDQVEATVGSGTGCFYAPLRACWQGDWDATCRFPPDLLLRLEESMQQVLSGQQYLRVLSRHPTRKVILAADASDWGAGSTMFAGEASSCLKTWSRIWSIEEQGYHINQREALAALEALQEVLRGVQEPSWFILAIDNTAAQHRLDIVQRDPRKAFGPVEERIRSLRGVLRSGGHALSTIRVASAQNPADPISRGKEIQEEHVLQMKVLVEAGEREREPWFAKDAKRKRDHEE